MAKRGLSSVQRTLRACRDQGRFAEKVEQWIQYGPPKPGMPPGIRRDVFGFIDIIAIDTDAIVGIQACTGGRKAHWDKILANEYALPWLQAYGKIELWSWTKKKVKRGGIAVRWTPKIEQITEADIERSIEDDEEEKVNAEKSGRKRGREQEDIW